jgi:hypothetical protein
MRAAKVDINQNEIVKLLRQIPGVSVHITSRLGDGFPDLVVGYMKKITLLVELKRPGKIKLTDKETEFKESTQCNYIIAQNVNDILKQIKIIE